MFTKKANKHQKGITIILVLLITTSLMFLSLYLLSFSLTEKLIAKSQALGGQAYYLAEAGINEMVWLIKNDSEYQTKFETESSWATTTSRTNPFGANTGSYYVTLTNTSPAHGEILSTGTVNLSSGNSSRRAVKILVYKPMGQSGIASSSGYADGNIDISNSLVNFIDGDAHSNLVFKVNGSSVVNIDGNLKAVGNYIKAATAVVNLLGGGDFYAANMPNGPAAEIPMPAVDFDSSDLNSYKNRATIIYSESNFDDLMDLNQVLTLTDPITYVTGDVELKGDQTLIIDEALLIVEKDFTIGFKKNGHSRNGPSNLIIQSASGTPAGVLAGRHVDFKQYTEIVDIYGVVYGADSMNLVGIDSYTTQFDVRGGLLARKLTISSCWHPINITHDNEMLINTLGSASSSPTIIIEHWEEEY
ncbi:MAG: hypothetical protein U9M94_04555 [Patescibacteria group bacterium]|nr:hypothetical protein [Patescibacteria group bacterium]